MIDDIDTSNTELWKYVDDTTIAEPVAKNKTSMIQNDVNELVTRSEGNKFQLNQENARSSEFLSLRISFAENKPDFAPIFINGKARGCIECQATMSRMGSISKSGFSFNNHTGIPSGPDAFLEFKDDSFRKTEFVVTAKGGDKGPSCSGWNR